MNAFMTAKEVAILLGLSPDTLRRRLPTLNGDGFPPRDPILRLFPRASVEAWVAARSTGPVEARHDAL